MSRYAISGVAGFLGSHLARRLTADGHEVAGVDKVYPASATRLAGIPLAEYHWGDAGEAVLRIHPVDAIIHCASITNIGYSWANTEESTLVMTLPLIKILQAMQLGWAKKLILISTHSVYGRSTGHPFTETDPTAPTNPYGVLKLFQEQMALAYARTFGLPVTVLRMALMYGENEREDATPRRFLEMALRGETIRLEGGGKSTRDFNYVQNAVDAIEAALLRPIPNAEVYNIGGGEDISIRQLAETAIAFAERGSTIDVPERPGEEGNIRLSYRKAAYDLAYSPQVNFEEGFRRAAEWAAQNWRRE